MTKIAGSGPLVRGADPDPDLDTYQNVTDPQYWSVHAIYAGTFLPIYACTTWNGNFRTKNAFTNK